MDEGVVEPGGVDYVDLKHVLKALGDEARLKMVAVLARGAEINVTDLGQLIVVNGHHISQPLVSWHLSILRRWGLVRTRRIGRQVYCSLDITRYQACLHMLDDLVAASETSPAAAPAPAEPPTGWAGRQH